MPRVNYRGLSGSDWPKVGGSPNAAEVREGMGRAIQLVRPDLLHTAFHTIVVKFDMDHSHTICYTSNNIAVEYPCGDGKKFVARPENDIPGRTPAQVIKQFKQKLFERVRTRDGMQDPVPMSTWFKRCNDNWGKWIANDHANGGPLSGQLGALVGAPAMDSEEFTEWKRLAGVGDPIGPHDHDSEFDGDIDEPADADGNFERDLMVDPVMSSDSD